ncbi:hypothetical protein EJB05_44262 [Eragrostis curvula]|uniref:Uncharacterized protein n=1 Tax=Eragrostis curvula TaxID=38414 RepID=A0A5J9THL1_9POAL|nr:hypothetical protein EJB05_44262 [Eragrostis curvula]
MLWPSAKLIAQASSPSSQSAPVLPVDVDSDGMRICSRSRGLAVQQADLHSLWFREGGHAQTQFRIQYILMAAGQSFISTRRERNDGHPFNSSSRLESA